MKFKTCQSVMTSSLVLIAAALLSTAVTTTTSAAETANETQSSNPNQADTELIHDEASEGEDAAEPGTAILFLWFIELFGILIFYVLSRHFSFLPQTAVMFLMGTLIGIGVVSRGEDATDLLSESVLQWVRINGEVLLLVFLPGLVFRDAFSLNVHLFLVSFCQCLILAFPMVLAGTVLTALVAFYIFPFGWSFNLAMTFGSILAATDPVAVSALLNEVGAPPRLKMHISGESLLNDGSAIVFFTIFSMMFLTELDIDGVGEAVTFGKGVAMFFQMSLGGMMIGLVAACGLVFIMHMLSHRLNREENAVQVAATVTMAYLTYYIADVAGTSGVIAVVFLGVGSQALGSPLINDPEMMDSFWVLVEHLLNTFLFALGGVVWGSIIADVGARDGYFNAREWGYLLLLVILVNLIRTALIFSFYPITSKIGLKSNINEALFASFGGLRGAVGIALALSLDNEVWEATHEAGKSFEFRRSTTELFGMVGGVAFFSLAINGSLAGPLLRYLHLADETESREKIVRDFKVAVKKQMLDNFVELLTDSRFEHVDFAAVKTHVVLLKHLSFETLKDAVLRYKKAKGELAIRPNLKHILPYLEGFEKIVDDVELKECHWVHEHVTLLRQETLHSFSLHGNDAANEPPAEVASERLIELRKAFILMLQAAYKEQIENGELEGRDEFISYVLLQGLEFAADEVAKGLPLRDWQASHVVAGRFTDRISVVLARMAARFSGTAHDDPRALTYEYQKLQLEIHRAFAFVHAHRAAQKVYSGTFDHAPDTFCDEAKRIVQESKIQVGLAVDVLLREDIDDVYGTSSHLFCKILLNKAAKLVASEVHSGLLKESEANEFIEEIEKRLHLIKHCSHAGHGKLSDEEKRQFYKERNLEKYFDDNETNFASP
jgi:NhaP-type Na+/H+ or K+/H+ antiporter